MRLCTKRNNQEVTMRQKQHGVYGRSNNLSCTMLNIHHVSKKLHFCLCQLRQMWKFNEAQTEIKMQIF